MSNWPGLKEAREMQSQGPMGQMDRPEIEAGMTDREVGDPAIPIAGQRGLSEAPLDGVTHTT